MCSSLLGLGGTHVQQCSECRISRICVPYSRSFKRNSITASYQHHTGLQPANLVTITTLSCSRRRSDLLFGSVRSFFTSFLQFIQYFVFFRPSSGTRYLGRGIWPPVSGPRYLGQLGQVFGPCPWPLAPSTCTARYLSPNSRPNFPNLLHLT